jgi:hypothetical protein
LEHLRQSLAQRYDMRDVLVMSRHTAPHNRRIDDAFPIRVKVVIPAGGLGNLTSDINFWISDNITGDRCRNLPVRAIYCQATAYHFRTLEDAQAFLDAFPMLELADGVEAANLR